MTAERTARGWYFKLAPSIAVLLLYYGIFARPLHTRNVELVESQQLQTASLSKLESHQVALSQQLERSTSQLAQLAVDNKSSSQTQLTSYNDQSAATTFAELLLLFQAHHVICLTTVSGAVTVPVDVESTDIAFELVGSFPDMQRAIREIVVTIPHVLPRQLSLERQPDGNCHWNILFQSVGAMQ